MKGIDKDISEGNFKKAYLIFGEEDYLVKKYALKLENAAVDKENALMNVERFDGNCDVNKIISAGDTAPFFSEYRVVVVSDSGLFKDGRKADTSLMAEAVKNIPDGCIYLFTNEKVDKRNALYKAVKKIGYICEINYRDTNELVDWIIEISDDRLNKSVASYFVRNIGNSMEYIKGELGKLLDYCGENSVKKEDVDTACTISPEVNIFNMVGAIGNKNIDKAIEIYNNMIFQGQEPIGILAMIARQFRLMLQCKYLQAKKNYNSRQIAAELKQRDFVVKGCLEQGSNFKLSGLIKAIEDCAKCDEDIKSGAISAKLGVEVIIFKYGRK